MRASTLRRLCRVAPRISIVGVLRSIARRRERECCSGAARQRPVAELPEAREFRGGALRDQLAAASSRAGAQIDHVIGAANRVLVVLDHDQRIALGAQPIQGVEQRDIVARMQADGRLVQHVAHALQIRAELRRQANALRLAAGQRRGGAIQLQIARDRHRTESVVRAASSANKSRAMSRSRPTSLSLRKAGGEFLHRQIGERGDRLAAEQHVQRDRIQALPRAVRTGVERRRSVVFAPRAIPRRFARRRTAAIASRCRSSSCTSHASS